ncbi:MAG: hypothetical protein ACRDZX_00665, partial [Acidimicrobiales bacterium]
MSFPMDWCPSAAAWRSGPIRASARSRQWSARARPAPVWAAAQSECARSDATCHDSQPCSGDQQSRVAQEVGVA